MRKLLRFLPFHFLFFLILGIYTQLLFEIWRYDFNVFLIIHVLFLLLLWLVQHKKLRTFLTFVYFLFVGISTGANVAAALKIAERDSKFSKIVTVSPSNAERYLSTELFKS